MKILQINTWFKNGSTGKIVESLHSYLTENNIDSYVLFGRGQLLKSDKTTKKVFKIATSFESKFNSVLSRFTGIMYGGCFFSTKKAFKTITSIKPDIIHIHCTNSFIINNYKLFRFLGEKKYKVVITLHAEYLFTGSCSHSLGCEQWIDGCEKCPRLKQSTRSILFDRTKAAWKKMYESISCIDASNRIITSVSSWLKDNAKRSLTFRDDAIEVIHNGINTSIFRYYGRKENHFYELKNKYKKVLLYATPNFSSKPTDIKGGDYFLKIVDRFSSNKDILFVVAGGNKYNFNFSFKKNVLYVGNVFDQKELAKLYSACDATLMLSRKETYSLVTAESISCGTRVIGFKSGGPESIAISEQSKFFEFGDLNSVIKEIESLSLDEEKKSISSYSSQRMNKRYLELYQRLIK